LSEIDFEVVPFDESGARELRVSVLPIFPSFQSNEFQPVFQSQDEDDEENSSGKGRENGEEKVVEWHPFIKLVLVPFQFQSKTRLWRNL